MKTKKPHKGVRFVVQQNDFLRDCESESLVWLVEGKSGQEAALIMGTTEATQKTYRKRIMEALGANNAPSSVAMAFYHRILTCLCLVLAILQTTGQPIRENTRRAPRPPFTRQLTRCRTRQGNELKELSA